jgi:hypothetical protein
MVRAIDSIAFLVNFVGILKFVHSSLQLFHESAFSRSNVFDPYSAEKAENLLKLQSVLSKSGCFQQDCSPDFQSYTIVMNAYASSANKKRTIHARRLLMELLKAVHGKARRKLGFRSVNLAAPFTAVINAAGRSDKGINAFDLSDSLTSMSDPYSIAMQTYSELRRDEYGIGASPDHHTFTALLRCVKKHTNPFSVEREIAVKFVFDEATELGQVSKLVMKELVSIRRTIKISTTSWNVKDYPSFWRRNVDYHF